MSWGFVGVGSFAPGELARLASVAEENGYDSFWMSLIPGTSTPLAMLEATLAATQKIDIGLGVVPVDSYAASDLASTLRQRDWPWQRVVLGVGAGQRAQGTTTLVEEAVAVLRRSGPPVRIGIGAYGPRMLRTAGRIADVLCLNFMTPERLAWSISHAEAAARIVPRDAPVAYVYVHAATGSGARRRVDAIIAEYGRYPHQARHQSRMGHLERVGITVDDPHRIASALEAFTGAIPVIRAVPEDPSDLRQWMDLARFFAPA